METRGVVEESSDRSTCPISVSCGGMIRVLLYQFGKLKANLELVEINNPSIWL